MRNILDFDDAGAGDDHPANGVSIGDIRAWHDDREKLRCVIKQALAAYDSGNLQLASPEIGEPENNIPLHPWHEEWIYYARAAVE